MYLRHGVASSKDYTACLLWPTSGLPPVFAPVQEPKYPLDLAVTQILHLILAPSTTSIDSTLFFIVFFLFIMYFNIYKNT